MFLFIVWIYIVLQIVVQWCNQSFNSMDLTCLASKTYILCMQSLFICLISIMCLDAIVVYLKVYYLYISSAYQCNNNVKNIFDIVSLFYSYVSHLTCLASNTYIHFMHEITFRFLNFYNALRWNSCILESLLFVYLQCLPMQ